MDQHCLRGSCPQGLACSAHQGSCAAVGTKTGSTVILCLQHALHLQGPVRRCCGVSSLQEDTVPSPLSAPGLKLHKQLFLYCLVCAVSLLAVGLLWLGLYIQECSQKLGGSWHFLWVNFGSPGTKNSSIWALESAELLWRIWILSAPIPHLGRFGYVRTTRC